MNSSRSLRGSARTGATLGSISARKSFESTVLADPCSPAIAKIGYGPPARSAPNNHATTSTKSFSLARFKNGASASIDPPRSGSGSGCMLGLRRNLTGGSLAIRHPLAPISIATPELIDQIEVDQAVLLGKADRDLQLRAIELGPCFKHIDGCVQRRRARRVPGPLVVLLAQPALKALAANRPGL